MAVLCLTMPHESRGPFHRTAVHPGPLSSAAGGMLASGAAGGGVHGSPALSLQPVCKSKIIPKWKVYFLEKHRGVGILGTSPEASVAGNHS